MGAACPKGDSVPPCMADSPEDQTRPRERPLATSSRSAPGQVGLPRGHSQRGQDSDASGLPRYAPRGQYSQGLGVPKPSARTTNLDIKLAESLQAEDWNREAYREQADARVAASLQAETWWGGSAPRQLQAEAWQICTQRVTQGAGAKAQPLADKNARPPSEPLPQVEEVMSAADQLQWKLSDYGLRSLNIVGDGACQFRAVADQLYQDQELHASVRERAVAQLKLNAAVYQGFAVGENFSEYLARMEDPHTWGDNLSLQAIADTYRVEVCLVTSYMQHSFICIKPGTGPPGQQIWLGFYAEYHYTSLEPLR